MMKMKKTVLFAVLSIIVLSSLAGCGKSGKLQAVEVAQGEKLVYLPVTAGEAASFDQTPDWAPEPDPLGAADGDMLTRWSSDYQAGEQWIYFDLGKESVVSDVIVRWERAYAADYIIQGSNDAVNWQDLCHEQGSKGGTKESTFAPVKCRYIKVLGLERANDDWGISIWETEIFGPASLNPGAVKTKEEYLSKAEEESKREEADKLVKDSAAPVVPLSEQSFQKGVVYTSWMADELSMPASDFSLVDIKNSGFNTVAIMVAAYQEKLDSTTIFVNDGPDGDTPNMESLKHAIQTSHKIGMRAMVKPHVDPRTDEARINIMPSEKWFDSYKEFIVKYAKFSEENGAQLYSVGTELEATTFDAWTTRWNDVIDSVRAVYKGALTYSANWTEYKEVPFWDKLDYIGIDAYFPIAGTDNPTPEELVAAWEKIAGEIETWLTSKGLTEKGVIFTEVGYPSAQGAARQPWAAISSIEDQKQQADCLDAMFQVMSKRSWFKGYYIWQYFPQERWSPLGFTVKGKQSEEVVKKWVGEKQ